MVKKVNPTFSAKPLEKSLWFHFVPPVIIPHFTKQLFFHQDLLCLQRGCCTFTR